METKKNKAVLSITYNAPVVLTFALLALIVLFVNQMTKGAANHQFFSVYRSRLSVAWFIRLFCYVLGHSSFSHFAGNMTLFLLLGPILEEKYGSKNLLEMIAITTVLSGIINMIFFPRVALLGASGIVFMMIILVSSSGLAKGKIPLTMILVAVIYLGSEVYAAIFVEDNISQFVHIVGGVCGALFAFAYERLGIKKN